MLVLEPDLGLDVFVLATAAQQGPPFHVAVRRVVPPALGDDPPIQHAAPAGLDGSQDGSSPALRESTARPSSSERDSVPGTSADPTSAIR